MQTIALIAHNSRKTDLLNWAKVHRKALLNYNLIGTTNTSKLLSDMLILKLKVLVMVPVEEIFYWPPEF